MLSDILSLESLFSKEGRAIFMDELIAHYGYDSVIHALKEGYIEIRRIYVGPDQGRDLCCLSDEGRFEAQKASLH
ncbi:MAG: hypothetical protein GC137_04095 [Alphaproteobacteria bacterium]|nr:hypothetical protein [Alphaproteobacteria bacterium]